MIVLSVNAKQNVSARANIVSVLMMIAFFQFIHNKRKEIRKQRTTITHVWFQLRLWFLRRRRRCHWWCRRWRWWCCFWGCASIRRRRRRRRILGSFSVFRSHFDTSRFLLEWCRCFIRSSSVFRWWCRRVRVRRRRRTTARSGWRERHHYLLRFGFVFSLSLWSALRSSIWRHKERSDFYLCKEKEIFV